MVFKMAHGSLFAVLLRSPWWYSVLIAMAIIAISVLIAGGQYVVLGIFTSLPFLGIAAFALYKQALLPSDERVLEVVEQARSMPALKIAHKIAQSYTPHRYDSAAFSGDVAELEITRGNKKLLLSTKRFKAGNTGIEPLKKLVAAGDKCEATGYLYLALGDVSDAAMSFAEQNDIEIIQARRLAAYFDGKVQIE